MKEVTRRYVMKFPPQSADKALSYRLIKDYDIKINILKAEVRPGKTGSLCLNWNLSPLTLKRGSNTSKPIMSLVNYSAKKSNSMPKSASTAETASGSALPGALTMDREKWELHFDPELCVVCELCVPACPMNLFEINFHEEDAV